MIGKNPGNPLQYLVEPCGYLVNVAELEKFALQQI